MKKLTIKNDKGEDETFDLEDKDYLLITSIQELTKQLTMVRFR